MGAYEVGLVLCEIEGIGAKRHRIAANKGRTGAKKGRTEAQGRTGARQIRTEAKYVSILANRDRIRRGWTGF